MLYTSEDGERNFGPRRVGWVTPPVIAPYFYIFLLEGRNSNLLENILHPCIKFV